MFSFLDDGGAVALGLSDELTDEFLAEFESVPVVQYGRVMRGYVSIPDGLLSATEEIRSWLQRAHGWIGSLEPKPTKRS